MKTLTLISASLMAAILIGGCEGQHLSPYQQNALNSWTERCQQYAHLSGRTVEQCVQDGRDNHMRYRY